MEDVLTQKELDEIIEKCDQALEDCKKCIHVDICGKYDLARRGLGQMAPVVNCKMKRLV